MSALGHATRREILILLRDRELSSSEIADRVCLSRSAVSNQLALLVHDGLLELRRSGVFRLYHVRVPSALRCWDDYIAPMERKT